MRLVGLVALGCLAAACGCGHEQPEPAASYDVDIPVAADATALPSDAAEFLAALQPSSHGTVRVTYDVTGPAGMGGTLVVTQRPGGIRHETWALEIPLPSTELSESQMKTHRLEGARIVTPDVVWTDAVDGAAVVRRAPLGELARAYEALDPGLQSLVMYRVRYWQDEMQRGRSEHAGEVELHLGRTCLLTRVASHRVCVWEDTGLTLSYAGEAFRVVATRIEVEVEVDDVLFEIPDGGQRAVDDAQPLDGGQAIIRLASGDYADLAGWLRPSLQLGPT